jgi:filamentous hemagglutinin family protein
MRKTTSNSRALKMKLIAAAVSSCFASAALANPTGVISSSGVVSMTTPTPNVLEITNNPGAIINWQGFSISAGELTRFIQNSASSAVLNRVMMGGPQSDIMGTLTSNGRVFLINPNGIVFGAGSMIDVAGLVASSLNLSDGDFLAGRMNFQAVSGAGRVASEGNIFTPSGGQVYLVGPAVSNGGIINSPQGEVILAAGNSVELMNTGTPGLSVSIDAPANQAVNLGQIFADSGRVGIFAGVINQGGVIGANTAVVGVDGSIKLVATQSTTFAAGSSTTATGALDIDTGELMVAGDVHSGVQSVHATGGVLVQNVPGGHAQLGASSGQTINAKYVEVNAVDGSAFIGNVVGDQVISTTGANAAGDGLVVRSMGSDSFAGITQMDASGGTSDRQLIDVRNADRVVVAGVGGFAAIESFNGFQSLSITGAGSGNALEVGSVEATGASFVGGGGTQVIRAGNAGEAGSITLHGAAGGPFSFTSVSTNPVSGGSQTVSTSGSLQLVGGSAPSNSGAGIFFNVIDGQQIIQADSILMQGGPAGVGNGVFINSVGSQYVNAGAGGITLVGSSGATNSPAGFFQTGADPALVQSIVVSNGGALMLRGGDSGSGNGPVIAAAGGQQSIDVDTAGIAMIGGAGGASNFALITQNSSDPSATQTVRSAGPVLLRGGDGNLDFAMIRSFGGHQDLDIGTTTLLAGAGGIDNFSNIQGRSQDIHVHGDLAVTARGSGASPTIGGGARIGGTGGSFPSTTSLSLRVDGNLTMTGGDIAGTGALLGNSSLVTGSTDINVSVGGAVSLNGGTVPGTFAVIGSRAGNPARGNIAISADGGITLNSTSPDQAGIIRTTDDVTLNALQVTQGPDARIEAGSLTVNTQQGAALTGNNAVDAFNATNTWFGDVALHNTSPLLTMTSVQNWNGGLQVQQAGDLLVNGNVSSGPQSIDVTGGLVVQNDPFSVALLSANGGQTINAGYVEVNAMTGGSSSINNWGGGQVISTRGSNAAGEGLVVRSLGDGFASIQTGSGEQHIDVRDADSVAVDGVQGYAGITNFEGVQTLSLTGTGANALRVGSPGALGQSSIGGGSVQTILAGNPGEQGSITLRGATGGTFGISSISTNPVPGGSQTVSTSGAVSLFGGSAPSNSGAGIFANGIDGQQAIRADSILLQGGSAGSGNSAIVGAISGSQSLIAGAGGIALIGGSDGATNYAQINQFSVNPLYTQSVQSTGPVQLLGGGGNLNFAMIRAGGGQQDIVAGDTTLLAGAAGIDNFANIQGSSEHIEVHGNLALVARGSAASPTIGGGARIGGLGASPSATSLKLDVDGDLTMTGGSVSGTGALLGNTTGFTGPTNIDLNVGGDVVLSGGTAPGTFATIGSRATNLAGGDIAISAGGTIALNSTAPDQASIVRTTDGVTLSARQITQGPDSRIEAGSLAVRTQQSAALAGNNSVSALDMLNSSSGSVSFNNTSALLTVTGIDQVANGALALNQAGNLLVNGDVGSGAQTIGATGDMTVAPGAGPNVTVQANGAQTFNVGGTFSLLGGSAADGFAQTLAQGPLAVQTGGDLLVQGGSGKRAFSELYGRDDVRLAVGGVLHIDGGPSALAYGKIATDAGNAIFLTFPNLGSGGYFVNDREGSTHGGLDGFFSGHSPARPGDSLVLEYGM